MHNLESVQENERHKILWDFKIQTDHLILARRPDLMIVNKKKKLPNCGLCCPGWPQSKIERKWKGAVPRPCKGIEKKKLWNMKVTVIPILIGALGTVTKGLVKRLEDLEIRGQVETIQTKARLRSARILRSVLETWRGLLWLKLQWETTG